MSARSRRALGMVAAIFLIASAAVLPAQAARRFAAGTSERGVKPGLKPPEFSLKDLQGKRQSFAQYKGDVILLHFWATWCPYCRAEIPKLTRIHKELGDKGVTILSVSVDQNESKLRSFVDSKHIPYVVIPDVAQDFQMASEYAIAGVPVTYVIGRDGRIVTRLMGGGDLYGFIESLSQSSAAKSTDG